MSEMSPLARLLMRVLRSGTWVAAALLVLFAGILLWQRWTPAGLALQSGDVGFLTVLALLLALALYLVRGIAKELDHSGS